MAKKLYSFVKIEGKNNNKYTFTIMKSFETLEAAQDYAKLKGYKLVSNDE